MQESKSDTVEKKCAQFSYSSVIIKEEVPNHLEMESDNFSEQQLNTTKETFIKNTASMEIKTPKKESQNDNNNEIVIENLVKKSKNHACEICGKFFSRPAKVKRHMETHGFKPSTPRSDGKNLCSYCGRRVSQLNAHVRRHLGEKPFKCEHCQSAFSRMHDLKRHKKIHSGEKPHLCKVCGKGFAYTDKLKCHLRIHTGERPYKCIRCGQGFNLAKDLTHHVRRHTGEKPHECGDCGKRFIQKTSLRSHCRSRGHCFENSINHEKPAQTTILIRNI